MHILYTYLSRYKKYLVWVLVLSTIFMVFSLADTQFLRIIIDRYASDKNNYTLTQALLGAGLMLLASMAFAFVSRTAKNFQQYYLNIIGLRVETDLYTETMAHAFRLPYQMFEDQSSGALLEKVKKASSGARALIESFIGTVFVSIVGVVFVIIYGSFVHWSIGLGYFVMIPIVAYSAYAIGRKIKSAQADITKESARLSGSTTETLRNVELVKSLGLESQEIARLASVNAAILELELKKQRAIRALSFSQGTIINFLRLTLIFLMVYLVVVAKMTVGEFFILFIYSFYVFNPLQELGTIATKYFETKANLEALEDVRNAKEVARQAEPAALKSIQTLSFEDVTFLYPTRDTPAVKNISITAKTGETIAFVGPSGSGKTTLIKLLTGLYEPTTGCIKINDKAIDLYDRDVLRKNIGLVLQDTQLFAGTIGENLRFVRPDATDEECVTALTEAQAKSLIERTGEGLLTRIGESGLKLSGGERQRLAIARALLREPALLIFDEATSALDSITEHAITETIRTISHTEQSMIKILVAHRLSTVKHADRIYVLEKGALVESGTHESLLAFKGLYAALWREQGGAL